MQIPSEDRSYRSRKEMLESLVVMLGGRVAEALVLDDISTGASNDIERATKTVRSMIVKYGMSENLGPIKYGTDSNEPFLGRDMGHVRDYSEETASEIDAEIRRMMHDAYNRTETILKEHMDKLHEVAKYLFLNEKMSGEDFARLMEGIRWKPGRKPPSLPAGRLRNIPGFLCFHGGKISAVHRGSRGCFPGQQLPRCVTRSVCGNRGRFCPAGGRNQTFGCGRSFCGLGRAQGINNRTNQGSVGRCIPFFVQKKKDSFTIGKYRTKFVRNVTMGGMASE